MVESRRGPTDVLDGVYGQISTVVGALEPVSFLRPTRADSWCVQDLLFHMLLDAQRALITFASPTPAAPDVDEVSYWRPFRPGAGDQGVEHARFVRIASAAYSSPAMLARHWNDTSAAAVRAARSAPTTTHVQTQGHVLTVDSFVHTLVVEATIHYLDLTWRLEAAPPDPDGPAMAVGVLTGLLGEPVRAHWGDEEYVLKATGRLPLTAADREALGAQAERLPLLG